MHGIQDGQTMKHISHANVGNHVTWEGVVEAMHQGHLLPKAEISDQFLKRGHDTLLSRAAWIDGLGIGVKSVSVMAQNTARGLPSIHGAMLVFEDETGQLEAIIDSDLVTAWKTTGDSALGAKLLARTAARSHLIIGAGIVAENLVRAYSAIFPGLETIEIWNRTASKADALAAKLAGEGYPTSAVSDLPSACARADIISTATMSQSPILQGKWITPGTHVDLIGAFKSDMREADDALLQKGRLFVDSFDTTLDHIGELMIPIASGAISKDHVLGDFYDLARDMTGRTSPDDITVFKNGGGAHLDLMTAKYILSVQSSDP